MVSREDAIKLKGEAQVLLRDNIIYVYMYTKYMNVHVYTSVLDVCVKVHLLSRPFVAVTKTCLFLGL